MRDVCQLHVFVTKIKSLHLQANFDLQCRTFALILSDGGSAITFASDGPTSTVAAQQEALLKQFVQAMSGRKNSLRLNKGLKKLHY